MLILNHRPSESLYIGFVLTVLGIKGNQVRIGITAPKHVVIDREEIHARKMRDMTVHYPCVAALPQTHSAATGTDTDPKKDSSLP